MADMTGTWIGEGRWRDSVGESHAYHVRLTLRRHESGVSVAFRHDFVEEAEQDAVELSLDLDETAPAILSADVLGVGGVRGYMLDDMLHYTLPIPGNAVEATYVFFGDTCIVAGSSEKNAAGHYIMWDERLTREA
ncbi:hypothetical protein [Maritimibacter dapengensis]|uniref:DUF1579 domain-containing protein n=1 Tax=Maritimibacter dapengensis TaxID=2836868 RepID=A0ABS6T2J9_9RHOB|nr:hypothetical protein [Maritimibacter dapengensis]MBV7378587.1 hypothetical protein [Maritimibacter dapengensis]